MVKRFLGLTLMSGAVLTGASVQQATLTISEPTEDAFLAGPVELTAHVEPESTPVRRIDFFVDGALICQITSPPFVCRWDAGQEIKARLVRVAATLETGERLVQNVRTKSLDLSERVSVDAVMVPVVVTDGRGRFIGGLQQTSFRIFEGDIPQSITFFQSENIPLDVAVAVDVSASMEPVLIDVKEAVSRFIGALKPIDRLTLVAFNDRVFVLTRQDTNTVTRPKVTDGLTASGRTSLRDAMIASLDLIGGQISRRAVVVFTDGEDTRSMASLDAVERRIRESDASLYIITQGAAARDGDVQRQMQYLARVSGGRAFAIQSMSQLPAVLDVILSDLSHHYLLGYAPSKVTRDSTYRKIRVTVMQRGRSNVRARDGYWAIP